MFLPQYERPTTTKSGVSKVRPWITNLKSKINVSII